MDDRDPKHWEDEPAPDAGNGEDSSDFDTADPQDGPEDAEGAGDREDSDDWIARAEHGRVKDEADLGTDKAHGAPPNSEQHRWRRLLAVALAFAVVSWLVSAALVSFAFVTVVKQNDDHVAELTDLLEEGQAQRGSVLGSAEEQTEQRQAVLLNERAKTQASSAQARESRASREAALADAERSQSEATRADAQARSADDQGALAVDQQRTDEMVAAAEARNEDAQAKLAEAQQRAADRAAGAGTKLTRAQAKLADAERRAAEALAALADACRQRRLPGCLPAPLGVGPQTDQVPRTDR